MTLYTHADGHTWDDCVVCGCHAKASPAEILAAASRLANGERVEPDYEAAAQALWGDAFDDPWDSVRFATAKAKARQEARAIVDAAIGGKLLADPPTEED